MKIEDSHGTQLVKAINQIVKQLKEIDDSLMTIAAKLDELVYDDTRVDDAGVEHTSVDATSVEE